jgi:hypothetical protein
MAFRTSSVNLNVRHFSRARTHEARQRKRPHPTEVSLEITEDVISDQSIHGIVVDWLVPTIVDHVMKRILRHAQAETPVRIGGYYEHNNLGEVLSNDEKPKGWAPAEAGSAEADAEAPIVADECRVQGVKRIRNAAEFDSK